MNKVYSAIGLARRAGFIVTGETGCIQSIRKNKCNLLIIASNASFNTKDKFLGLCKRYNIDYIIYGTKEELGQCIGKSLTATIVVNSPDFVSMILKNI